MSMHDSNSKLSQRSFWEGKLISSQLQWIILKESWTSYDWWRGSEIKTRFLVSLSKHSVLHVMLGRKCSILVMFVISASLSIALTVQTYLISIAVSYFSLPQRNSFTEWSKPCRWAQSSVLWQQEPTPLSTIQVPLSFSLPQCKQASNYLSSLNWKRCKCM